MVSVPDSESRSALEKSAGIPVSVPVPVSPKPEPPGDGEDSHAIVQPNGELRPEELTFRLGLLLASSVFLIDAMGAPWAQNPIFLTAAFLMSALVVLTLASQWQILGDWRRSTQQLVLFVLAVVLTIPLCATLNPTLGLSALPESIETAIMQSLSAIERIPGFGAALSILKGMVVFIVFCLVLLVMAATGEGMRRGGLVFLTVVLVGLGLFFYPMAETVVGIILLVFFFRVQWERPLMIPDKLRPHLSAVQLDYLRELLRHGALSTGETKLYLDNNAAAFGELLDFGLVEYDNMVREVRPGRRLQHDPACEAMERGFGFARRGFWMLAGIVYFFLPDLIPGPLDDFIIMALCTGAGFGWLSALFGGKRGRPRY